MAASEFLKARQTRYGAYLAIYVIVIVLILGAINYLSSTHNKSFDTTSNKRLTLSDQTKNIVSGLKSDITITYFQEKSEFARAKDLLDRYSNLSNKIHVKYVDPKEDPVATRAAGIQAYPVVVVGNGVRNQEAKTVTEEEVTGALIRTLKTGDRLACFTVGAGELGIEDQDRSGLSFLKAALEKSTFKTQTVSLAAKPDVPTNCSVLIIAGPKNDYPQPAVEAVKKYVDGGGHGAFFINPAIDFGKGDENGANAALTAMISGYGVTLNNDMVLDGSGMSSDVTTPIILQYDTQPIVASMRRTITLFPLSRSLDVKSPAEKLFSAGDASFSTTNLKAPFTINEAKDKKGPFVLAAAAVVGGKGRIVVVGSSNWIRNEVLGSRQIGNRDLVLNMVNWLTADEELIGIRPKDPEDRRISMTSRQISMLFFLLVVVIPLAVILVGTSVYLRRR